MGRKCLIAVMLVFLMPLGAFAGNKSPWEMELPFKSATIHYTIRGIENGSEVKYIRDYGREVATYHTTKTSMMGMTMVTETVDIDTPDWQYHFDLSQRTGTKSVNPQKYMIEEYNKLSKAERKQLEENAEKMGKSVTDGFGGTIQQNAEKILGYSCDRAEMMGTVVYNIHATDIPLRLESNMMGMSMKIEATSVDEGKVDGKFFLLPQGIAPQFDPQSDAMARQIARQTITMLKDPESAKNKGGVPMMQRPGQQQLSPEEQEQMEQAMEMLKGMFGNPNQQ
ncbi:MAG: hypothetical protein KKD01_01325 [Proteobacteria bacterium]|nr:hypothetical protein [Pseudomonadota bacterium]MBU1233283.1 hypothetical protein [Pseudomonadota bacterium]MBU1418255.1 hypothetical protein [Pseudomonadota bacterium]MBU1453341.1 hypothetical protein [Pseudomonadota bacterium]